MRKFPGRPPRQRKSSTRQRGRASAMPLAGRAKLSAGAAETRQRLAAVKGAAPPPARHQRRSRKAVTPPDSAASCSRRAAVVSSSATSPTTAARAPERRPSSMAQRTSPSPWVRPSIRHAGSKPKAASPGA